MKTNSTIYLILLVCFFCTKAFAQTDVKINGKLVSAKNAEAIGYAAVVLTEATDSTKRTAVLTDFSGDFIFKAIKKGNYSLKISALGYKHLTMKLIVDASDINLGILKIEDDAISLKEVNVTGQQASVKIKKDTVEFNAGSFKTRPNAAVEELLKKLPGVEIDKDGNILVQGEKVNRLTVDGKDFFGTDPKTATKNLPADAISKVQIVDSKTREAKATGIDDGQREKVLNLTIKEDKKNGWFGNANLAGGTTDKYNGYLSANHFNKELQFAVLGMSNNISNSSFNFEDLNSFSGGNVGSIFAPPAGGRFSINVSNGRASIGGSGLFDNNAIGQVTTHSGGVNYSNAWGKKNKLSVSSSYFTYFSKGLGNRFSDIQDLSQSDILRISETATRNSDNQAHRFNLRAEYHPDSLTDIIFRPNVILNYNTNINDRIFNSTFDTQGKNNDGTQYFKQKNVTPSLFGEFSVLRRMPNNKGSVSLRLNGTQNKVNADWLNRSFINNYISGNADDDTDQQTNQANQSRSYTLNANYTRPIFNKKWNTSLSYFYRDATSDANQLTYNYNAITDRYETIVPDYSKSINSHNWFHSANLGLNYARKEWSYNFGVGLQQTGLDASIFNYNGIIDGNKINKTYYDILPRLTINYKSKTNQTIRLNYNINLNLPSANDLLTIPNNTDALYRRVGNPNLKLSRAHRISVNFNTFTPDNNKYWNGYFLYNLTFDDLGTSVSNKDGIQYVTPINVDGNYYINTGTYFGMPTKIKGLRMGYGLNLYTSRNKGFISSEENTTNRYNVQPNGNFSYDIDEKLNASIYLSVGYNKVTNSIPLALDNKYFSFENSAGLSYEFIKDLRIDAQLQHTGSSGRSGSYNNNAFLLNAGFEKYMMQRRITLSLKGFDILNENINIDRSINNSRIEDFRYNNITRYFYVSLNYKLAKVGASNTRGVPRNTVN